MPSATSFPGLALLLSAGVFDPYTNSGIDAWGVSAFSIGPGTWTRIGEPSPAPVPVPPALLLFGSALGLGGLMGWRRKFLYLRSLF